MRGELVFGAKHGLEKSRRRIFDIALLDCQKVFPGPGAFLPPCLGAFAHLPEAERKFRRFSYAWIKFPFAGIWFLL